MSKNLKETIVFLPTINPGLMRATSDWSETDAYWVIDRRPKVGEYYINMYIMMHDPIQRYHIGNAMEEYKNKSLENKEKEIAELKEKVNVLTMADMTHQYNEAEAEHFRPEYERQIIEPYQQEIERLKGLLEKEFKNFRDTDSVERRWQQFKTENSIEDAAIYTGNSIK